MIKRIMIYKAPVYRVFTDSVVLENGIIIPEVKSETASDEELFYSLYRSFVSIKHDCILADKDEATDFLYYSIDKNKNIIIDRIKAMKGIQEEKELKEYLRAITSCLYFDEDDIEVKAFIPKAKFKELKNEHKKKK